MSKLTLVAVIRNEAPYILEWMAHHLSVGAEEFVLCVHGSSDGTAKVTRRLAAMGYAAHLKIAVENDDPEASALAQIGDLEEIRTADWIGLVNVDQFLNIHLGHGGLEELLPQIDAAVDAFDVGVLSFGADGVQESAGGRISRLNELRENLDGSPARTVRFARRFEALTAPKNLLAIAADQAQINQYFCKSEEHLAVRLSTAADGDAAGILDDWMAHNRCDITDESIRRYDRWFEKYARFLRSDRRLRLAQKAAVNWHKERAKTGLDSVEIQGLMARVRS